MIEKIIMLYREVFNAKERKKAISFLVVLLAVIVMLAIPVDCEAHGDNTTINQYTNRTTTSDGMVLAFAAAQNQLYYGTYKWQGSLGVGSVDTDRAVSFSVGRRPCKTCPLFTGTYANDGEQSGYGGGVHWQFK